MCLIYLLVICSNLMITCSSFVFHFFHVTDHYQYTGNMFSYAVCIALTTHPNTVSMYLRFSSNSEM